MIQTAKRIQAVEEYYFSKKLAEVRGLDTPEHRVINLGIGSPDMAPAASAINALTESANNPANHGYQNYKGISQLRKGVEIRESDDTAVSAKRVRDLKLKDTAAIANEYAAKKFGLNILEKRIETNKKNFTRFLILNRRATSKTQSNKASLSFEVANHVGSLAEALTTFKDHSINLSKIQSIPIIGRPSEYSIHVDVEWKKRKSYDEAMRDILRQVKNLNILGEYKKAQIKF